MDLNLTNRNALITGSTAGIGYATAAELARQGADVVLTGRHRDTVDEAVQALRDDVPGAQVRGVAADLGSAVGVGALIREVPAVDVLVNNLGIFGPKAFADITDEDWQHFFDVNVMSGVRLARHYLQGMLERDWGRIVFVSSESGVHIPAEMIHYGVTKTAQLGVSRGIAEITAGSGVTCNAVLPGPTWSRGVGDFVRQLADEQGKSLESMEREFFREMRPTSLIQRFAWPQEVASMIAYVCSPAASATNGAALRVDGGVVRTIV
ncbi:MAG TPA: SDR family oxidoreductase [Gammaproteobacteria bacterium]|nr:SDR family oxidoreductase [Gammaproteobacteria bacterium]